jgi:hypothetical protein
MPNWCNNYLELEHDDPAMIARARKAFADGRLLDEFVPVPKDLHIVAGRVDSDDNPEQIALEAQEKANLEKHGYSTWYDYCVNEWGTKWDVGGDDHNPADDTDPNHTRMSFDSAWAPPCAAMDKFMEQGFRVTLYYYESGMAFCGVYSENGDDFYEIGGMSADEVADAIPSELDICMNISDGIREWEEDNQEPEELTEWYKDGVAQKGLELKTE